MPVFLKDVKRELQSDLGRVGKNPDGSFKFIPPSIVGRRLRDYSQLRVSKITKSASPSRDMLTFTALVSSENTKGIKYKVTIEFHNLKFKDLKSAQFSEEVKTGRGRGAKKMYHRVPTVQRNPVKLKCQCKDFQHRFEFPLDKVDGLIGAPTPYTRKTDPWNRRGTGGRPSVNSTEKVGICKHINSVLEVLKDQGMIKER